MTDAILRGAPGAGWGSCRRLFAVVSLALALAGCRRADVREFTVEIPGLTEQNRPKIAAALAKYRGIEMASNRWDFAARTLTVRYDSMQLAETNVRMAIADLGIEVAFPSNTTGRAGH